MYVIVFVNSIMISIYLLITLLLLLVYPRGGGGGNGSIKIIFITAESASLLK